ncbi:MAG: ParB/RepB/Spo0J family partition protein [Candidatus Nezhaarchaeales archaeon]
MKVEIIPVDKIYISPLNVRVDEEFGSDPEDEALKQNVQATGIKQLITVRPNGDRYEVILGRRRFLSIKDTVKEIPCIVREDWDDMEALKASLIENLEIFRKSLDPIKRAESLKKLIDLSGKGMTAVARELGMAKSTLSEYLKILELSPKMKELVSKRVIPFRDALKVAKLDLNEEQQESLAETAAEKGLEAFKKEVERLQSGKGKRGAPPGLLVIRLVFDPRDEGEKEKFEKLKAICEEKQVDITEYVKSIILEHIS